MCLGNAEELVEMRCVARAHLERAIDVSVAVGIAVDEHVHRELLLVAQTADEAAAGAGGNAAHADENAVRGAPPGVLHQPLEHPRRLDGQNELGLRLELQLLHRGGNAVGAAAEAGAVDAQLLSGFPVAIDHDEFSGDVAALFLGNEAQLLAVDAKQGFDVVHHRVAFRLLVEAGVVPVLRDVVGLSLRGDVVGLHQLLAEGHHAEALGEGLHRVHGEGSFLRLSPHLKETLRGPVGHIRQTAHRHLQGRALARHDLLVDVLRLVIDEA